MNSIFGRINLDKSLVNEDMFNESIKKLSVFSTLKIQTNVENYYGFSQIIFPPFKKNQASVDNTETGYMIAADCALYNRKELLDTLKISDNYVCDNSIILHAYIKWGVNCLEYLLGDFAFAIWDSNKDSLFCARDHFGVKPINYFFDKNVFVFSTGIAAIKAQKDIKFSIDQQFIADSLSIIKSENFRTSYNEIRKIPPAHYLFLENGKIEIKQYWQLKTQKEIVKNDEIIINEFKSILTESVKCRISDTEGVGSELSGGIDSSSVTAIASDFASIRTFSHVLPDKLLGKIFPFKDEREFINLLADYKNIDNKHFIASKNKSLIESLKKNILNYEGITQQNFGVFSDQLYKESMSYNISVLLSGFGGDEVVTSQSFGYLLEYSRKGYWDKLKAELKSRKTSKIRYSKTLLKYFLISKAPFVVRFLQNKWWLHKFRNLALNENFVKRLQIKKRYRHYYKKEPEFSLQIENIKRIIHPHVSQRLEYCSLIARNYGIEYRYPLLDKRLIEYYLAVPTHLKAKNGIGRYIIRKSMEGLLPKEIQWRKDKSGATIPTVFMRMINDIEGISEIIHRAKSDKKVQNFIDIDKCEHWFYRLCKRSESNDKYINPGAFYNYLKLILFIEQNTDLF